MTASDGTIMTPPVSERDHSRGPAAAPVTLVVYGDYECPYTRKALMEVRMLRGRVGEGLRFVFRNFPLTEIHPHALRAAEAAEAAALQGAEPFWAMHAHLFAHQDALEDADLRGYAAALGLDMARFDRDLDAQAGLPRIREDVQSGLDSGVRGTPTIFINGRRHDAAWDLATLRAAVERAGATPRDRRPRP
jgi:protein-disulfide isomerase